MKVLNDEREEIELKEDSEYEEASIELKAIRIDSPEDTIIDVPEEITEKNPRDKRRG